MSWEQGLCCNLCGKELDIFDIQNDFTIRKDQVGYGSAYDGDGIELRICNACFDKIAFSCDVSPVTSECSP